MNKWIALLIVTAMFSTLMAQRSLSRVFTDEDGNLVVEQIVPNVLPQDRNPGPVVTPTRSAVIIPEVPAFDWCYGCGATSAAMLAGYWDRKGYSNIYVGPANGGVVPLTNSIWGEGECPLSATHTGIDNLATPGHVERFWVSSESHDNDPFGTGDPTGTYGFCTADYMGTNQDWWGNWDGMSSFYFYLDGSPLHDPIFPESDNPRRKDLIRGLRQFFESRGYSVSTNFNQLIYGYDGAVGGFTYNDYKGYIDAGIPVIIHVDGHIMLGVGYDSSSDTIYIHNTWDYGLHSMTWGGDYSDMAHLAVSVLTLSPTTASVSPSSVIQTQAENSTNTQNLSISNTNSQMLHYSCSLPQNTIEVLNESFDTTSLPEGWTQTYQTGTTAWEIGTGGYNNNNPPAACDGAYNARFTQAGLLAVTKLISPALNLSGAASATLSFYHAQYKVNSLNGSIKVYYKNSAAGAWNLLQSYTTEFACWKQENITLPNLSSTYYLAFEGRALLHAGVCLDKIVVNKNTTTASWLSFNGAQTYSGTIIAGAAAASIPLRFNSTGLAAGLYSSTVSINKNEIPAVPITIPVTLRVTSSTPISFTSPLGGEVWPSGSTQTITWNYFGTATSLSLKYSENGTSFSTIGNIPTSFGENSYVLTVPSAITSTARLKLSETVSPYYYSVTSAAFSITRPNISVTPTEINMGDIILGNTAFDNLVISNSGNATLYVNITVPNGYMVTPTIGFASPDSKATLPHDRDQQSLLDYPVAPGSSEVFVVTFIPTAMGFYNGTIVITHNAEGAEKTIPITGRCVKPILNLSTSNIEFNCPQYIATSQQFSIRNMGNYNLTYALSIPDSISWLTLNGSNTVSGSLAYTDPIQTITIAITDNTLNPGVYHTGVNVISNDPDHLSFTIPVTITLTGPFTITYPTTGQTLVTGSPVLIRWTYDGSSPNTMVTVGYISINQSGNEVYHIIEAIEQPVIGENITWWMVPTMPAMEADYTIQVRFYNSTTSGYLTIVHIQSYFDAPQNVTATYLPATNVIHIAFEYPVDFFVHWIVEQCPNPDFTPANSITRTTTYSRSADIPVLNHEKMFFRVITVRGID